MKRLLVILLLATGLHRWGVADPTRSLPIVVPPNSCQDLDSLTRYLVGTAHGDWEKAERIYLWITANISYDVEGLKNSSSVTTAQGVLEKRTSICAGYANLFEALAKRAGLQVVTVGGLARNQPGDTLHPHGWNAVQINGVWRLVDCTWGAGYVQGDAFYRSYSDFYFLGEPKDLVTSHLPDDQKWQLLDDPISRADFEAMVPIKPHRPMGERLDSQASSRPAPTAAPSSPAPVSNSIPRLTAPKLLYSYRTHGVEHYLPKQGSLAKGQQEFHLLVPGASRVVVSTAEQVFTLVPVPKQLDTYRSLVPITPGKVQVFAEFGSTGRLEALMEYEGY